MAVLLVTSDIHKDRCDVYKDSCKIYKDSSDIYKDRSSIYEDTSLVTTNSHHIKVKSGHRGWDHGLLSIGRKNLCNSNWKVWKVWLTLMRLTHIEAGIQKDKYRNKPTPLSPIKTNYPVFMLHFA